MATEKQNINRISLSKNKGSETIALPVVIVAVHGVLIFSIWLALFLSKWFPYGFLQRIRDWLFRFF